MKKNKIIIIAIIVVLILVVAVFVFKNIILDNNFCTITSLNENLTNKEIQIEIKSSNKRTIIVDNVDTNQTTYKDTINKNGKYIYGLKNSKKTCEIEINNIDLSPPTGKIQYNKDSASKEIAVTIEAEDNIALDQKPYLWDAFEWTDTNRITVNKNGNYTVFIRDKAGNITNINYEINNIENIKRIENIELSLHENKKIELDEEIMEELNGTMPEYIVSNSDIISVNNNGIITGNNMGESQVSMKFINGNTYIWNVKVKHINVESVAFSNSKITLKVGKKEELKPILSPENSSCINENYTVNNDIAKVENGIVIADKVGESTVTFNCDGIVKNINIKVLPKVANFSLNKTSITLKPKSTANLSITNLEPSNSICDIITWSSDNTNVVTVSNGKVTGVKDGSANIKATCDGITKEAKVTVKSIEETIKPSGSILVSYESSTLRYYITKNGQYYLTYVWMIDPYNQVNKIDATTAEYNKTYTDDEMKSLNKAYKWKTVPEMVDAYIKNGRISSSKGLIAINGSGFAHVPYFGTTARNGYASGWVNITDSVIKRANTSGTSAQTFLAFDTDGTMQVYTSAKDEKSKKDLLNTLKNNKIKNTWSFGPILLQNGEVKTKKTDINKRNGLCQVNSNNFIIFSGTSRNGYSYTQEAEILKSLGCKTAYALDGGDSVSLVYKKNGATKSTVQYCNDTYGASRSSSTTHCRYIVEGVYFIEK